MIEEESGESKCEPGLATVGRSAPVLYAMIKRRSKYAYQGERDGRPVLMRVTHLEDDAYAFYLDNGNRYRREDLTFFAQSPEGKPFKLT
jgi:hypothetical protein